MHKADSVSYPLHRPNPPWAKQSTIFQNWDSSTDHRIWLRSPTLLLKLFLIICGRTSHEIFFLDVALVLFAIHVLYIININLFPQYFLKIFCFINSKKIFFWSSIRKCWGHHSCICSTFIITTRNRAKWNQEIWN